MKNFYWKSLNFYKNKWERHNKTYGSYEEALKEAERFNRLSSRAIEIYSVESRKSTLLISIPENLD